MYQVMLYAVRGNFDHDILEGSEVTVETKNGSLYHGVMGSVESEYISMYDEDEGKEICIEYTDIRSMHD